MLQQVILTPTMEQAAITSCLLRLTADMEGADLIKVLPASRQCLPRTDIKKKLNNSGIMAWTFSL